MFPYVGTQTIAVSCHPSCVLRRPFPLNVSRRLVEASRIKVYVYINAAVFRRVCEKIDASADQ